MNRRLVCVRYIEPYISNGGMFPVKTPKINVCARTHLCFTVLPLVESLPGLRMKLSPQWACVRSSYLDNPYAISQPLSYLVVSGRNLQA